MSSDNLKIKLDYDLIDTIGATHYYIETDNSLTVTYYRVRDKDLYFWCPSYQGWIPSSFFTTDHLRIIPSKQERVYEFVKAKYDKASQAVSDLETGMKEFYCLAKDGRYYKLTTAASVCKHLDKASLYIRLKKDWAQLVVEAIGWEDLHFTDTSELSLSKINYLSKEDALCLAEAILKVIKGDAHE